MGNKLNTIEFIERSKLIHSNLYDYSHVDYINMKTKIIIICKEHGEFITTGNNHLNRQSGCPNCKNNKKITLDNFIERANVIYKYKYNYDIVKFIKSKDIIDILCPKHGMFKQTVFNHLHNNQACKRCKQNNPLSNQEFINKSYKIHGDLYDYSKVEYVNYSTIINLKCNIHGDFKILPKNHLNKRQGCPRCSASKGEQELSKLLEEHSINFVSQKKFDECKNKRLLPFDFYLNDYNILIEYDGIQHFQPVEYFGGVKSFEIIQENDLIKNRYCKNNNIRLYRIKYDNNLKEAFSAILFELNLKANNK